MNSKIKNYVDVLFNDIPNTRKASELKEEILSTLNDHFEEHIKEGKSENQAYTEALADLGDVDELLQSLAPEKDIKDKMDSYNKFRAKNTAIAVSLYIFAALCLVGPAGVSAVWRIGDVEKVGIIGLIALLVITVIATGILVYTKMSVPQDVEPYLKDKKEKQHFNKATSSGRFMNAFMKTWGLIIVVVYLGVSFSTGRWEITWLIWLIGAVIKRAIICFFGDDEDEKR